MKRFLAAMLALVMAAGLCTANAFALSDADNGNIMFLSKSERYQAFFEYPNLEDYGFNIKGYVDVGNGAELIGSTYGNYGYHTFLNVDGQCGKMDGVLYYGAIYASDYAEEVTADIYAQYQNGEIDYWAYREAYDAARAEYQALIDAEGEVDLEAALSAMAYNTAGPLEQNIGGLKLKLENSYAGGGNYVKISYTVTNPTSSAKTFSLATTSDVQVNGDDSAILKMLPNGRGAKLVSDIDGSMFVMDGLDGGVDNVWIGRWGNDYFENMFNDSPANFVYDKGDSAICWSWTNRTIAAGESVSFYVLMEVGINQGPSIEVDDDLEDIGASFDGYIMDPNLGTVNLYYVIDNGEEQVIENIGITEERTPFSLPLSAFECGSTHRIKVWAVDDAGESSTVENLNFTLAHAWGMPEVTAAPTPAQPGTVVYTCTQCGATKTEYIYCGDASGDGAINSLDAALILRYDAQLISDLTPLQLMLCDANGDGNVNSLDAAAILRYDAGLITEFANASFSLEAYIQLCIDYYGYYGTPELAPEEPSEDVSSEEPSEDVPSEESSEESDVNISTGYDIRILGVWNTVSEGVEYIYTFNEDGTGTCQVGSLNIPLTWTADYSTISLNLLGETATADYIVYSNSEMNIYNETEDLTFTKS